MPDRKPDSVPKIECPHATPLASPPDGSNPSVHRCERVSKECGFSASMHFSVCQKCIAKGDNNRPFSEAPYLSARIVAALQGRLLVGVLPRYQNACPIVLNDVFAKYRSRAGNDAARALLPEMVRRQASVPVHRGGLSPDALAETLLDLARQHGMEEVL